MATVVRDKTELHLLPRTAWLPLATLPVVAAVAGAGWRPWLLMWSLAGTIYFGLKWLSFADCREAPQASRGRRLGYLLLWPGMDANAFFGRPIAARTRPTNWLLAAAKMFTGLALAAWAATQASLDSLAVGWIGMSGIVLALHFGLFHLLALAWQSRGVAARPLMNAPLLASSLADFWGRRWNLAFRDLAHAYVFQPFAQAWGATAATLAAFLASGVIHDVVISGPARAGWGMPTLYFLLQGCALLVEHSALGKRLGLARGVIGRVFVAVVIVAPLGLLFHGPFVERVVRPMLSDFAMR